MEAGSCDRCGQQPRLLATCGPDAPGAVCRDCALNIGEHGWCDGHHAEGALDRRWAAALPERWGDAVVLWWIATGEVREVPASARALTETALIDPDALRPALEGPSAPAG